MDHHRTNILSIHTPEGITFSLRLAGPVSRMLAWGIDLCCILVIMNGLNLLIGIFGFISRDFATALSIYLYFLVSIGYCIFLEWLWRGQTLGKRLLRLRVMDEQGLRLKFSQIVIRNLLRFADSLPICYLVGGLAALINKKNQRLGDYAANTIVTWHPRIPEPDFDQILNDKYNSFKEYPHLEARLRQRISPQQAGIALQALLRRNELAPQARVILFQDLATLFKKIVPFPPEISESISDEQYLKNMVDSLFRSASSHQRANS